MKYIMYYKRTVLIGPDATLPHRHCDHVATSRSLLLAFTVHPSCCLAFIMWNSQGTAQGNVIYFYCLKADQLYSLKKSAFSLKTSYFMNK